MSILINGMAMPGSCGRCPMYNNCAGHYMNPFENAVRGKDCPLVPVPPHGRLIDADALIKALGIGDLPIRLTHEIINAPTVLEAEEGDI